MFSSVCKYIFAVNICEWIDYCYNYYIEHIELYRHEKSSRFLCETFNKSHNVHVSFQPEFKVDRNNDPGLVQSESFLPFGGSGQS